MFRICKTIELESGHLLSKHPGSCAFPHGHTRSVELVFAAETLDETQRGTGGFGSTGAKGTGARDAGACE